MPSKPGALPERRTGFADVSFTGRLEDENSSFYLCINTQTAVDLNLKPNGKFLLYI